MTVTVQRFTSDHQSDLFNLSLRFFVQSKFGSNYQISEAKTARHLALYATDPYRAAWVALDEQGNLLGALGAHAVETFFGHDILTFDDSIFVLPTAQGKGVGKLLINAYVDWARSLGAKAAHIGITSGVDQQKSTDKILALGFEPWGQLTRKTLED